MYNSLFQTYACSLADLRYERMLLFQMFFIDQYVVDASNSILVYSHYVFQTLIFQPNNLNFLTN